MNDKQKHNIVIAVLAAVVVYVLFIMFTKKSGFDSPATAPSPAKQTAGLNFWQNMTRNNAPPLTQEEINRNIKLSNERAQMAAQSANYKRAAQAAQAAANQAHEQKKNEIRDAMRRSRQGGAEGAAGSARFEEIQNLVKQGDRQWKQALAEVFEMKG